MVGNNFSSFMETISADALQIYLASFHNGVPNSTVEEGFRCALALHAMAQSPVYEALFEEMLAKPKTIAEVSELVLANASSRSSNHRRKVAGSEAMGPSDARRQAIKEAEKRDQKPPQPTPAAPPASHSVAGQRPPGRT